MNIEDIKQEIIELAKMHDAIDEMTIDDFEDAEMIEIEAENLIIAYCEHNCYLIDGFPTEKRNLPEEELDEDYFCRERIYSYLDTLAIEKDDVAEIWWFYNKSFWPDWIGEKDEFLNDIKNELAIGLTDPI